MSAFLDGHPEAPTNQHRNVQAWNYAGKYLESTETEGTIISDLDGEFDAFLSTYSTDVNLQKRVPRNADIFDGTKVETAEVDRTLVVASDYDAVTEVKIVPQSVSDNLYNLFIHENSGDSHELRTGYLDTLRTGMTVVITQTGGHRWHGTIQSISKLSSTEAEILIDFSLETTGNLPPNTVTIQFGFTEDATPWRNVAYDGEATVFNTEGESKAINFTKNYDYRFETATAGSIIYIAPVYQNI